MCMFSYINRYCELKKIPCKMVKTLPITAKAKVTSIKQPKELAVYSRDLDGQYDYENPQHSYYYFPDSYIDRHFDLSSGFSNFKKIPEEQNLGDFQSILNGIIRYEQKAGAKVDADIITFRGIMTKLMTLPIVKEDVSLKVITFGGHIMIKNDDESELTRRQSNAPNEYVQKCEFSGYKFEKLVFLPKPWSESTRATIESRHKALVNNYEQTISIVRTGIGKARLLLAGEVDGIFDYKDDNNNLSHYIELKTNRSLETENQIRNYETKLYKTWAQCFLIGIKKIGVGFRNQKFLLENIELYDTDEIPILLKNKINCVSSLKYFGAVVEWLNEIDKSQNKSYRLVSEKGEILLVESPESFEDEFLTDEFRASRS